LFIPDSIEKVFDKSQPGQQLNARTCHLLRIKRVCPMG